MSLRESLRALPPTAWLLFAGTFVNRFGSFVIVFLVLYLRDQGYTTPQAGLAVSAYGLGSVGASLVGGHLADRLGRRNSIALWRRCRCSRRRRRWSRVAGRHAAADRWLRRSGRARGRGVPAGLRRAPRGPDAGGRPRHRLRALPPRDQPRLRGRAAAAGFLAERSFAALFIADAATSVVYGLIALVAFPHGRRVTRHEERRGEAVRTVVHDRVFLLFLAGAVAAAFVYMQHSAAFPLAVQDAGLSFAVYGTLVALNGIIIVLVELPLTTVTRRYPARRVIALGWLLTGVGFALTGLADTALALAATVAVWTVGEVVSAPVEGAYVADLAPERLRGRYMGAWSLAWGIGLVAGPLLGTALYAWRPGALWLTCLVLGMLAAALVLMSPARRVQPEPADAEAGPGAVR